MEEVRQILEQIRLETQKELKELFIKLYPQNPQRAIQLAEIAKDAIKEIGIIEEEEDIEVSIYDPDKGEFRVSSRLAKNLSSKKEKKISEELMELIKGYLINAYMTFIDFQLYGMKTGDISEIDFEQCTLKYSYEKDINPYPYVQIKLPPYLLLPSGHVLPASCRTIYLSEDLGRDIEKVFGHTVLVNYILTNFHKYFGKKRDINEKEALKALYVHSLGSLEKHFNTLLLGFLHYYDLSPSKIKRLIENGAIEEIDKKFVDVISFAITLISRSIFAIAVTAAFQYLLKYGKELDFSQLIESKPEERIKDKAFVGEELSRLFLYFFSKYHYQLLRYFDAVIPDVCPLGDKFVSASPLDLLYCPIRRSFSEDF